MRSGIRSSCRNMHRTVVLKHMHLDGHGAASAVGSAGGNSNSGNNSDSNSGNRTTADEDEDVTRQKTCSTDRVIVRTDGSGGGGTEDRSVDPRSARTSPPSFSKFTTDGFQTVFFCLFICFDFLRVFFFFFFYSFLLMATIFILPFSKTIHYGNVSNA